MLFRSVLDRRVLVVLEGFMPVMDNESTEVRLGAYLGNDGVAGSVRVPSHGHVLPTGH